jgi:hypothetical protein
MEGADSSSGDEHGQWGLGDVSYDEDDGMAPPPVFAAAAGAAVGGAGPDQQSNATLSSAEDDDLFQPDGGAGGAGDAMDLSFAGGDFAYLSAAAPPPPAATVATETQRQQQRQQQQRADEPPSVTRDVAVLAAASAALRAARGPLDVGGFKGGLDELSVYELLSNPAQPDHVRPGFFTDADVGTVFVERFVQGPPATEVPKESRRARGKGLDKWKQKDVLSIKQVPHVRFGSDLRGEVWARKMYGNVVPAAVKAEKTMTTGGGGGGGTAGASQQQSSSSSYVYHAYYLHYYSRGRNAASTKHEAGRDAEFMQGALYHVLQPPKDSAAAAATAAAAAGAATAVTAAAAAAAGGRGGGGGGGGGGSSGSAGKQKRRKRGPETAGAAAGGGEGGSAAAASPMGEAPLVAQVREWFPLSPVRLYLKQRHSHLPRQARDKLKLAGCFRACAEAPWYIRHDAG